MFADRVRLLGNPTLLFSWLSGPKLSLSRRMQARLGIVQTLASKWK